MTTKLPWSAIQYLESIRTPTYKGLWDASGGSYPGAGTEGDYYQISVAGTMGGTSYVLGDYFGYSLATWAKIPIDYLGFDMTGDGLSIVTSYDEASESPRAEVKLLPHFNGADGSTTFLDRSVTPHTLTAEGTAQNYLGMALGGVVATIVGIGIIILFSMQDTTRSHIPAVVYVPIGGFACLLGIGGVIVGLIMYRGANQ